MAVLLIGYTVGRWSSRPPVDQGSDVSDAWNHGGPVAVGDGYTIELMTRCSSPIGLAEYNQRVRVFGGTAREGKLLGSIDLFPNTGGRTHVLVYTYLTGVGTRRVQIQDRYGIEDVDLESLAVTNHSGRGNMARSQVEPYPLRIFLGTYSGEAYPLKFIPPGVLSEKDSLEAIVKK